MIFLYLTADKQISGFDTTSRPTTRGLQTATTIENVDPQDFGAEIRMIGSRKCVWQPATGRRWCWSNCIRYWTESAYIGNGKEVTNDPGTVDSSPRSYRIK